MHVLESGCIECGTCSRVVAMIEVQLAVCQTLKSYEYDNLMITFVIGCWAVVKVFTDTELD